LIIFIHMMPKTPWLARTFNFEFPISHFACIYSRLQGTLLRIEDLVKVLSEDQLEFKPGEKWSIKEHIGHLADLDELHEARLEDYKNNAPVLRAADMTNKKTYDANHNAYPVSKLMNNFRSSRNLFLKHLESLDETALNRVSFHPRLKKEMRLVDMAFFIAEHDDQHLVCMREIIDLL
jgi:hypothetical protein